ncbi:hypothetical protein ACQP2E_15350 [Actinoplanes sp. CA-015351]|uniref:hypothetical protein n=1 Tax=Actinoplanes sp. CA-015351 TaxID=3239897 RepID=UPI003D9705BB
MTESDVPETTEPGGDLRGELYWIIPGSIATLGLAPGRRVHDAPARRHRRNLVDPPRG